MHIEARYFFSCLLFYLAAGLGNLEYRIQNGYLAETAEFPAVVLLTGRVHRCTGTLIAPDRILTAGHCACGDSMTQAYANVTDIDLRQSTTVQHRKIVQIAYPIPFSKACDALFAEGKADKQHEIGGTADVAILTTEQPFNLIPGYINVGRLRLYHHVGDARPATGQKSLAPNSLVLGFGRDSSSGSSGLLRFGESFFAILCLIIYHTCTIPGFVNLSPCPMDIQINVTGALCSRVNSNYQMPEIGDSGGPLLSPDGQIIGVTSISGHGWIVFASVANHAEFIKEETKMKIN